MDQVVDYGELQSLLRCVAEVHHARVMAKWGELSAQYKGEGQRVRILRGWVVQEGLGRRRDVYADLDAKDGATVGDKQLVTEVKHGG